MFWESVDTKIKELGFELTYESNLVLTYERKDKQFDYIHGVDLVKKTKGIPIIQSYQKDTPGSKFDYMVGLKINEAKLFLKKIKNLKWR